MALRNFTSELLSASTNGRPIKIVATATPGTTVHTAPAGTDGIDHIWLWLANGSASAVAVTVELGGVTSPDDLHPKGMELQANSPPVLVLDGQPLNNGLVVKVFAGTANVITATGRIKRVA